MKEQQLFVIFSEEEENLFWSNKDGWGHLTAATVFNEQEKNSLNLPRSHAEWVPLPYAVSEETDLRVSILKAMPGLLSIKRSKAGVTLRFCGNMTTILTKLEGFSEAAEALGYGSEQTVREINDLCDIFANGRELILQSDDDANMRSPTSGLSVAGLFQHKVMSIIDRASKGECPQPSVVDDRTLTIDPFGEDRVSWNFSGAFPHDLDELLFHESGCERDLHAETIVGRCENAVVEVNVTCGVHYATAASLKITFCDTEDAAAQLAESFAATARSRFCLWHINESLAGCKTDEDFSAVRAHFFEQAAKRAEQLR